MKVKTQFLCAVTLLAVCIPVVFFLFDTDAKFWCYLAISLVTMSSYAWFGNSARDKETLPDKQGNSRKMSLEAFGDTCYYLGFISTLFFFIACLFDIQDSTLKLSALVQKFGIGLFPTIFGLVTRLSFAGFKLSIVDAQDRAGNEALSAIEELGVQVKSTLKKMNDLQSNIIQVSENAVSRVSDEVAHLSKSNAELAKMNRETFKNIINSIGVAGKQLISFLDGYAEAVNRHMQKGLVFPDDYFVNALEAPLGRLALSIADTTENMTKLTTGLTNSLNTLRPALEETRTHSSEIGDALSHIIELAKKQESLVSNTKGHVDSMKSLAKTLATTQEKFAQVSTTVATQNEALNTFVATTQKQQAELASAIKKQQADIAAANKIQSDTLTRHIEESRKQYAEMAGTVTYQAEAMGRFIEASQAEMLTQGSALNTNIEQQTRISSAIVGQTETMAQRIEAISEQHTRLTETAIAQNTALTNFIELNRRKQEETFSALTTQAKALTQHIERYADASDKAASRQEILCQFVESNQQQQQAAVDEITIQSRALTQYVDRQSKTLDTLQSLPELMTLQTKALARYVEISQQKLLDASTAIIESFETVKRDLIPESSQPIQSEAFMEQTRALADYIETCQQQLLDTTSAVSAIGEQYTDISKKVS
ncbi:MAG: hypothetical protein LBG78_04010, partial [Azoarcus sp.]|nr:hypothetical protein [Azoarcus sp.]